MKLKIINDKLIGETLAVPIYNTNGIMFINRGTVLNKVALDRVKSMGISTLFIEDNNDDFSLIQTIEPVKKIIIIRKLKNEFDSIKKTKKINEIAVENIVKELIENINLSENAFFFNNIGRMQGENIDLVIHSVNVAIMALFVGAAKRFDIKKIYNLGLGALLHDIGKLVTDKEEDHPLEGYKMARQGYQLSSFTNISILQHHENVDGTGYPYRLTGDKINEFPKIIAVCDGYVKEIFDNNQALPYLVLEKLMAQGLRKYDLETLQLFKKSIYCYPNGLTVRLSNGDEGVVIMQNKGFPDRPVIKVNTSNENKYINLMKDHTKFISQVMLG